jgi:hypothetical protein
MLLYRENTRPFRHLNASDARKVITRVNQYERKGIKKYLYKLHKEFSLRIDTIKNCLAKALFKSKKITNMKQP